MGDLATLPTFQAAPTGYSHTDFNAVFAALTIANAAVTTNKLQDGAVTFQKMASVATQTLLGRSTAGTGLVEALTLGAGLALAATVLTVGWLDTDSSHRMRVACGSNITADRTVTLTPGDSDRTITLSGNPTLADWFDQSVKVAASPTFAAVTATTFTGALSGNASTASVAPAGTLTGTTLAANVVTTSITTVGALTTGSINWAGNIVTSGSITGGPGSFTTLSASPTSNSVQFQGTDGIIYRSGGAGTNPGYHRFRYFDTDTLVIGNAAVSVTGTLSATGAISGTTGTFSSTLSTSAGYQFRMADATFYELARYIGGANNPGLFVKAAEATNRIYLTASGSTGADLWLGGGATDGVIKIGGATVAVTGTLSATGNPSFSTAGAGTMTVGNGTSVGVAGINIANGASSYSFFTASDNTHQFLAGIDHTLSYGKVGMLSNHDLGLIVNNAVIATLSSTGLAVTGTLTGSGDVAIGGGGFGGKMYVYNGTAGKTALRGDGVAAKLIVDLNGAGVTYLDATEHLFRTYAGTNVASITSTGLSITGVCTASGLATFPDICLTGTDGYINATTTAGSTGYGFRNNAGSMEFKNNGGAWAAFSSGGSGTVTSIPDGSTNGVTWTVATRTTTPTFTFSLGAITPTTITMSGALSGVTTLSMSAGLSGVTTIVMAGALSGVTTLAMSGALSGGTTSDFSTSYKVAGIKVIGAQALAEADIALAGASYGSESATIEDKINNILAKLRTHGLIAT